MSHEWVRRSVRIDGKFQNPVPTSVGDWRMMVRVLRRYLTNKEERTPKKQLGPFHTDERIFETPPPTGLRVTWMGHSAMLIEIDSVRVLIDPVWDERAAPMQWVGPKRFFAAPLPLKRLPRIDVVIVSHDHYDHLGAGTVRLLAGMDALVNARWATPLGVGAILSGLGVDAGHITELDWTESVHVGLLKLTALPARHFSGRSLFNRFETLWASFVLEGPEHRVYYGADSGEWAGFAEIGNTYGPFDLTMLEIGAFDRLWADIHMGPDGAMRMFRAMNETGNESWESPALMMPIHWGLFDLALHAWRQPIRRIFAEPGLKIWSPKPGVPTDVTAGVEVRSEWWR
jgi:L-ascorbate metabolism protein UlaG (beta-lactamase superfamily)